MNGLYMIDRQGYLFVMEKNALMNNRYPIRAESSFSVAKARTITTCPVTKPTSYSMAWTRRLASIGYLYILLQGELSGSKEKWKVWEILTIQDIEKLGRFSSVFKPERKKESCGKISLYQICRFFRLYFSMQIMLENSILSSNRSFCRFRKGKTTTGMGTMAIIHETLQEASESPSPKIVIHEEMHQGLLQDPEDVPSTKTSRTGGKF